MDSFLDKYGVLGWFFLMVLIVIVVAAIIYNCGKNSDIKVEYIFVVVGVLLVIIGGGFLESWNDNKLDVVLKDGSVVKAIECDTRGDSTVCRLTDNTKVVVKEVLGEDSSKKSKNLEVVLKDGTVADAKECDTKGDSIVCELKDGSKVVVEEILEDKE